MAFLPMTVLMHARRFTDQRLYDMANDLSILLSFSDFLFMGLVLGYSGILC